MNPTTNPQQNQGINPQDPTAKANQAKASLAFATHLQTQMMQHQAPPKPQEAQPQEQNAPQDTQPKDDFKAEFESFKTDMTKQFEELKKGITEDIKADIADALQQDAEPQS